MLVTPVVTPAAANWSPKASARWAASTKAIPSFASGRAAVTRWNPASSTMADPPCAVSIAASTAASVEPRTTTPSTSAIAGSPGELGTTTWTPS